jgi:EAL domain-containing protein (putative c-di-GMP-specific phosphodiesterase class I)
MNIAGKTLPFLKQLGIKLCVNHFGTGNFSLQQLKKLPIQYLKIDQSLLADLIHDNDAEAIVKMIIALSQTLKINVVAEGVESALQKQRLNELGCYLIQGDMICPPISVADFTVAIEKKITESH